ncbi:UDP-N-acetylglucosamine--N-acetylmuramyl-(pentapeptide) pyrophosphoryl-undecaprenol N-acetylglucosamine transferase [bacterium BMS3Abin02]|nr:UDP-N-acetylglucosamine--N-acetylmuramyl-(pentapeptide) pyrophosphoryl-undecaprenol N-acetylglucosamine transferase [bacterium BMS3Abin02]HDL50070.1 UDP-N-acetylglucosamine--N-acetylmuramyl-(pentapeptide) pyrophosphoryl-undecaprenol N-acetylglucosamine transferase [Actinomycetota bacterium]
MSYAIAAAGTGGHVYPGLAIAEELERHGVAKEEILFIGGDRLEAQVYPGAGFPFLALRLQGLSRSLSVDNLKLPFVVRQAARRARNELQTRGVKVVLGMGSYVTVPVGWAAHRMGIPLYLHEQNGAAGLANRIMSRWARTTFVSFDGTRGVRRPETVGTPIRRNFLASRADLRHMALARYGLDPGTVVVGVFGGSLGAGVLNAAIGDLARRWNGPAISLLHLVGTRNVDGIDTVGAVVPWVVVGYEDAMEYFYAACDLVVSRAGGVAVAEIAATHTPAILVPGGFGGGHQASNAAAMERAGAAVHLPEEDIVSLEPVVRTLVENIARRREMAEAAVSIARVDAAERIAATLVSAHG